LLHLQETVDRLCAIRGMPRFFLAMAIGAFSALAFPPVYFFPALLFGYASLLVLLDGAGKGSRAVRAAALIGWAYGFGIFFVGLHWIGYPFFVNAEAHAWLMPFAIVMMPSGLALFFAVAAGLYARYAPSGPRRVFLFAVCFAGVEWLRGHIFTGFPWNIPGYGWGASDAILQSASLFGVYGLSFFTLLLGASLVLLAPRERAFWLPAAATGLFLLLWIGGTLRLVYADDATVPGVQLRIVQPSTPQSEKYVQRYVSRNWQRLIDLTAAPADIEPTHIIWPEAAPPFLLARDEGALREIAGLLGDGRVLLTGAVRTVEGNGTRDAYNSFYVIGDGGRILETYDKFHLVPFGEYLPFERTLNSWGITQIGGGVSGFSEGPGPQTLEVPGAPPVSPLICYEVVFPGAVTAGTRPAWFVNITDDSWFGPNAGPSQHLLIARVRAIEEGLPIARAANAGISVIMDGYGRIRERLELDERDYLDGPLPVALSVTPYAALGELPFLSFLIVSLGAAFLPHRTRRT